MRVIFEDFNHKGKHFDNYMFELPDHIKGIEDIPEGKLEEYIRESLDIIVEEEI